MIQVQWLKIYTDIFDNEKIKKLLKNSFFIIQFIQRQDAHAFDLHQRYTALKRVLTVYAYSNKVLKDNRPHGLNLCMHPKFSKYKPYSRWETPLKEGNI